MNPIGKSFYELETPALLLDLDKFEWNIEKMFKFAKNAGVEVRPHAKTFKTAAICNKLIEAGALGIMTQKLSEAEVLLNSGILYGEKNILISQEISDPRKIEKLVGLSVAMGEGKVLTAIENVEEQSGLIFGVTLLRRLVPGWFLSIDLGTDSTNVGVAIEF